MGDEGLFIVGIVVTLKIKTHLAKNLDGRVTLCISTFEIKRSLRKVKRGQVR